jgi:hypothetical protein
MECSVPSSIDLPYGNGADYDMEAPMAFRRERNWFLSFVMTPFKDIDVRAVEEPAPRQPRRRRDR